MLLLPSLPERWWGELDITPALLHGDLWSGNVGIQKATLQPKIFDPASYYGHNEAELSISRMFGGFPETFYAVYHDIMPKTVPVEEYWERQNLYEIFHYLNHTLLFGGGYTGTARHRMERAINFTSHKAA